MKSSRKLSFFLLPLTISCVHHKEENHPNIILIMADDMGFSDLGCTGAEIIQTPNLDYLASNGTIFTNFYNAGRSCPTRASLLTGLYPHKANMGWMTAADLGRPGYGGDLAQNTVTIAEALKAKNYRTYMTGKWHVTHDSYMRNDASKHNWPHNRGFDHFFGTLTGGGSYYTPRALVDQDSIIQPSDDFYLTSAINDSTVSRLEQHFKTEKETPFFFYVAHYAPHRPLHALEQDIQKYEKKFMIGWDSLRALRYQNQLSSGMFDSTYRLTSRDQSVPPWESLHDTAKVIWAKRMAVYAAQIDRMDQGIGHIMEVLKKNDALDNTLIMFLSDNGGCAEPSGTQTSLAGIEKLGSSQSEQSYHTPWANVSVVPFRLYKSYNHQGGITTPLIVHWPKGLTSTEKYTRQQGHVIDLMATILDVANIEHPGFKTDTTILPLQGKSLVPALQGKPFQRGPLFFEHEGNRAIINGDWKLVALGRAQNNQIGNWELYNIKNDPTEMRNLADVEVAKAEELKSQWNLWAEENQVLPLDNRYWHERIQSATKQLNAK